jgi:hypothetical protein
LEDLTGFYVGDDLRAKGKLLEPLIALDNIKDRIEGCRIVKTCFPMYDHPFFRKEGDILASKAILTVRSPIDLIPSLFELMVSQDFYAVCKEEVYQKSQELFSL